LSVVASARISNGAVLPDWRGAPDERLIAFLAEHGHMTPFEHVVAQFYIKAPIFVVREVQRHRSFCLSGDTLVSLGTRKNNYKRSMAEIWRNWHEGVTDSMGRTRFLPSCRDLSTKVLNENTQLMEQGKITQIWKSGIKELYFVETESGHGVKASVDHGFLTPEGWVQAKELRSGDFVARYGMRNTLSSRDKIPPALRSGIQVWVAQQKPYIVQKNDRCYLCGTELPYDLLGLDHVIPVALDITKALRIDNLKPVCSDCHHHKSNGEQKLAIRRNQGGSMFSKLIRTPYLMSEEETFDIEINDPHHNYVANGLVVHNSFNERSGRYKEFEPEFYEPTEWRAQDPKNKQSSIADDNLAYAGAIHAVACDNAFKQYKRMLQGGVAREMARMVLPLATYTEFYMTGNLRNWAHFLDLRNAPEAQWEIRQYAIAIAQVLQEKMPLSYAALTRVVT